MNSDISPSRAAQSSWVGLALLVTFTAVSHAFAAPNDELLARGKALYDGPGSCVTCHMTDGKGQPGSIPALAGSEWLRNSPDRTIAIMLRGLIGPVKVNNKRFYSAMPPQLLFNDEQLALMVSYVNNAWGNQGEIVDAARVAKARATLPQDLYTPHTIIKAFPFAKNLARRNGYFKPDFDDALKNVSTPVVYRTFMPGASPAAFAVALPGDQFYCWDAGECRLRYVWAKGGFIRGNRVHWSSNGKPVAEFNGVPYYRARSSLLNPEDYEHLADTTRETPFYDTSEADDFPIKLEGSSERPRYKGYRLVGGYPEFRYQLGQYVIRELITTSANQLGIDRAFSVTPPTPLTVSLTPTEHAITSTSVGTITADRLLLLTEKQSQNFTITIVEKNPAPKITAGGFE
ncbi:MAG: c-type cytochrome [Verrucomicrobiia bacterium]|jgi:mono/diheme cytochrome c family protein